MKIVDFDFDSQFEKQYEYKNFEKITRESTYL